MITTLMLLAKEVRSDDDHTFGKNLEIDSLLLIIDTFEDISCPSSPSHHHPLEELSSFWRFGSTSAMSHNAFVVFVALQHNSLSLLRSSPLSNVQPNPINEWPRQR